MSSVTKAQVMVAIAVTATMLIASEAWIILTAHGIGTLAIVWLEWDR